MYELSKETIDLISSQPDTIGKIATRNGKQVSTVLTWLRENHIMLTTADSLKIIKRETGLTESQILVEKTEPEFTISKTD